jgi:peptidoglycan/xylan/chitin deacetylase (PgdA/CDA1 family)
LVCLNFHCLSPGLVSGAEELYSVDPQQFEEILGIASRASSRPLITFDDGFISDVDVALPALQRSGFTASFFVPTDHIGRSGFCTDDDIRTLHNAGMEVGSHGTAHVRWTEVPTDELFEHVGRSVEILSGIIGKRVDKVAVPFGAYDNRVLDVLRRHDIKQVYTSDGIAAAQPSWLIPRTTIRKDIPLADIERWVNSGYSHLERARKAISRILA